MLEKIESLKTAIAQITASNKEEVEALLLVLVVEDCFCFFISLFELAVEFVAF